ncbi:MAG: PTS system mannose/fructose/sorbose family transporter subunit IID [Desulfomonilaceae bacterium]|nr:PTS system mannose/fructose/sorbose family transporter subunit IID [Desulfomonilaceae bacterium]
MTRRVVPRSFFLETLWNYERMQSVGFVFCLYPALKRLYPEREDLRSAVSRQLNTVNTNPAMGPLLAGITARLEHERASSEVLVYRKRAMAALAALGDHVFWGRLKPLAAVCGVVFSLIFLGSMIGSAAALIVYNVPNILARSLGFSKGWTEGLDVFHRLDLARMNVLLLWLRKTIAAGLGIAAGMLVVHATQSPELLGPHASKPVIGFSLLLLTGIGTVLLRRNLPMTVVMYVVGLAAVVVFVLMDTGMLFQ